MFCREKNKFKDPLPWERDVHNVHDIHQTENKFEKRAENAMKNNDFRQFMNIDVLMLSQTRFFAMGKTSVGRGGGLEKKRDVHNVHDVHRASGKTPSQGEKTPLAYHKRVEWLK